MVASQIIAVAGKTTTTTKNSDRDGKQSPAGDAARAKRIVVIDQEKVKPNSEAFRYLTRQAFGCGKACIQVVDKKVIVSETACATCVNRCKQCPGNAVSVVKLPTNLTTDTTHSYGSNSFKLHGLPIPRIGHVLGLLGSNGIGKSSALKILSGRIKPNLGNFDDPPDWSEIITYYRGSDLQNYFRRMAENNLKVAIKPQLEAGFVKRLRGNTVKLLMEERDERGTMKQYARDLDLFHLMDRKVEELSGGELQRFAAACTMCKDADVYMFDEVTSFLDVKQRLKATELIRSLVHGNEEGSKKYVIVVEHDLAILDCVSDFVQCLYGSPGVYGVVTGRSRVRNGINQYLAGYFNAENMRFRDHELTFKVSSPDATDELGKELLVLTSGGKDGNANTTGVHSYPAMSYTRTYNDSVKKATNQFTLHVESGYFREGECIVLLGENGAGKTTFMENLAGRSEKDSGSDNFATLGVAYKMQGLDPKLRRFKGTIQDVLEKEINHALSDRRFRLLVLKPLQLDAMFELLVASLSGGEMQRLSIALYLGKSAMFYMIDEPSAGLDCEQRVIAAKVMKRWVVNQLGRTLVMVEHDVVMVSAIADKVVVYTGTPGVECVAHSPALLAEGFNRFLKTLDVTFRRDPDNFRPRINKKGSLIDKVQRAKGDYYQLEMDITTSDESAGNSVIE